MTSVRSRLWIAGAMGTAACQGTPDSPPQTRPVPELTAPAEEPSEPPVDLGPAPTLVRAAEPPADHPAGFAALRGGTVLNPAASVERVALPGEDRVYAWAIVDAQSDMVTLRNLSAEEARGHCADPMPGLYHLRLRAEVPTSELATIVRSPWMAEYADGTRVSLRPGAVVGPEQSGRRRVRDGSVYVVVGIDDAFVGRWFETPYPWPESTGVPGTIDFRTQVRYGRGESLDVFAWPVSEARSRDGVTTTTSVAVASEEQTGGQTFATFQTDCLQVRGRIDAAAGPRGGEREEEAVEWANGGVGYIGGNQRVLIAAGTRLVWPDGTPAGEVVEHHRTPSGLSDQGGFRCWTENLDSSEVRQLRLCLALGQSLPDQPVRGFRDADDALDRGVILPGEDDIDVEGEQERDVLRVEIRRRSRGVVECYENVRLTTNPKLRGRLDVHLGVRADGTIATIDVAKSTLRDDYVVECVKTVFGGLKLPRKNAASTVVYPLRFEP